MFGQVNFKTPTTSVLLYAFFVGGSISCFIPFMSGYHMKIYQDNQSKQLRPELEQLENSFKFYAALVASIAACFPIILDAILDLFLRTPRHMFDCFVPRNLVIFAVILPDLFTLFYVLPYRHFDWLYGIIGCRGSMFNFLFLWTIHKLVPSLWPRGIVVSISSFIMITYICRSFEIMNPSISYRDAVFCVSGILIALSAAMLLGLYCRWMVVCRTTKDKDILKRAFYCHVYATTYILFFCFDWIPLFALRDPTWNEFHGVNYLTMYTYALVSVVIVVTISTSRLVRSDANDMQQMFVRYMSHEIRTPLNTVFLGLRLIEQDLRDRRYEDCSSNLQEVKVSAGIGISILNDMLLYDKVQSDTIQLDREGVCPWPYIRDTIAPMHIQAREAGIEVKYRNLENLPTILGYFMVDVDVNKFSQVIRNVFSNALKFTPRGKAVEIVISIEEATVGKHESGCGCLHNNSFPTLPVRDKYSLPYKLRIDVIDEGVGISKICYSVALTRSSNMRNFNDQENQNRLFHEIIQFSPGKLQNGGGSGLGLFISKGIMDAHGGTLSVFSEGEGCGTVFTIEVPARFLTEDEFLQCSLKPDARPPFIGDIVERSFNVIRRREDDRDDCKNAASDAIPPATTSSVRESKVADSLRASEHREIIAQRSLRQSDIQFNQNEEILSEGAWGSGFSKGKSQDYQDNKLGADLNMVGHSNIEHFHSFVENIMSPPTPSLNGSAKDSSLKSKPSLKSEKLSGRSTVAAMSPRSIQNQSRSGHILIVDDSFLTRKMMLRTFQRLFAVCVGAEDGEDAVAKYRSAASQGVLFDVILMDYQMPNMDGPSAAKAIRDLGYTGPIFGVTGNVLTIDVENFIAHGADEVLSKPLDLDNFEEAYAKRRTTPKEVAVAIG